MREHQVPVDQLIGYAHNDNRKPFRIIVTENGWPTVYHFDNQMEWEAMKHTALQTGSTYIATDRDGNEFHG